jgi:hypothetical protein
MHPGSASDTLRLAFSEPLAAPSRSAPAQDLFTYKVGDAGSLVSIAPARTDWASDGLSVQLVFDTQIALRPGIGDFVRLNGGAGLAADALGNTPGSEARFRLITGERRLGIQTQTFTRFSPDAGLGSEPALTVSLESGRADIQAAIAGTGRIGVLMEADLADFTVGDGFTAPSPSEVRLEYEFSIFTNLGAPVASEKRSLACTDELFQSDCRTHHGRVFAGWNYTAKNHEKVATGAYVILFQSRILSQGKVLASNGVRQIWGLLRSD